MSPHGMNVTAAISATAVIVILAVVAGLGVVYGGLLDPAADKPHYRPVAWLLDSARESGVELRARGIEVPDLADPALIRFGAGNYDAMCAGCHLMPGVDDSEIHRGLYPSPPAFPALSRLEPALAFWTIKHGIKASGMPAWGMSMEDRAIWGTVAFLQKLPDLSPEAYRMAVENSDGHSHAPASSSTKDSEHHDHSLHKH